MRFTAMAVMASLALAGCGDSSGGASGSGSEGAASLDQGPSDEGAGTGGLPDGVYVCTYSSAGMLMTLGTVTIRGDRYAGFSGGRYTPYSAGPGDQLAFPAGFVGVPDGFEILGAKQVVSTTTGLPFIEIEYGSPRGWRDWWTCATE